MPHTDWDPRHPTTLHDQRAAYDAMRATCPVAYSDFLGWSLFRHDDIVTVLDDPTTFSSASRHVAIPNGMDPPEHTRYRNALTPFFDAARLADFEPHCRATAAQLAELMTGLDELEFVGEFAEPYALGAECDFLGWPDVIWGHLQGWTHGNQEVALSRDRAAGKAIAEELARYVTAAIRARHSARGMPCDDLTSRLMATEIDGKRLNDEDLADILRNWIAGHGTVAAALGILVFHLAKDPALQQRLRDDPSLIPAAVDEILRVDDPLVANRRTTTRPVDIGGRHIDAGEKLTLMWITANRDPEIFSDPDTIELDRDQNKNLVFGEGIHDCIGAGLARLELRVALEELLARTSAIEFGASDRPVRSVYPSNGFARLPVRLCPPRGDGSTESTNRTRG